MKPAPKKQELVKPAPQALAVNEMPEYLRNLNPQEGFEEVRSGDIKIPRIALAQALTPQLEESEPNYIEGLKKGDFFNTISGERFGSLVKIVPLLKFGTRILFESKDAGGGILCRSDDMKTGIGTPGGDCATCKFAQFGSAKNGEGKGTACNEFYNFPVLIVGADDHIHPESLAVVSMKSSHIPAAQDLIAKARFRKAPMYTGVYSMQSKLKKFNANSAFIPVIDNAGWVAEADMQGAKDSYEFARAVRAQGRLKVDDPKADEFPEPGSAG
jgi:hypothetical protein